VLTLLDLTSYLPTWIAETIQARPLRGILRGDADSFPGAREPLRGAAHDGEWFLEGIYAKNPGGGPQGIFTVRPELLVPGAGEWVA